MLHKMLTNPLFRFHLELTPLELELLLDICIEESEEYYIILGYENIIFTAIRTIKNKYIDADKYLKTPQIIVQKHEYGYATSYNPEILIRLKNKMQKLGRSRKYAGKICNYLQYDRSWIHAKQAEIAKYVCEEQTAYIITKNLHHIVNITNRTIAQHFNIHESMISRLVSKLVVQLPCGEIIFIDKLIPGYKTSIIRGVDALQKLAKDKIYYDKKWKVTDQELVHILEKEYKINISRRTVSKYKNIMKTVRIDLVSSYG